MGCSGSKLSPSETDTSGHKAGSPHAQSKPRPRQARLSLAGDFNQFEGMAKAIDKGQPVKYDSASGLGTLKSKSPATVPTLRYAFVSQRGHYPDQPNKANQDAVFQLECAKCVDHQHFFGVLDGHGEMGAECADFIRNKLPALLCSDSSLSSDPKLSLHRAAVGANEELRKSSIDDSLSGTTACIALLQDSQLHVANVGDSRAVVAVRQRKQKADSDKEQNSSAASAATTTSSAGTSRRSTSENTDGGDYHLVAVDLTEDQTPFREDECERVKRCGARVLTLDQVEGRKDANVKCWTNEEADSDGDPPRLWAASGTYPGTAFTRSLGDSVAETIGVIAEPEVSSLQLTRDHVFLIIATDGVWEFVPSQAAVDIVAACASPQEAAKTLVNAAYKVWLQRETRTDDISVVVISFIWEDQ